MTATIKFDGGTQPANPGPSAIGYIVSTGDSTKRGSQHIRKATNNQTECHALIQAFRTAQQIGCIDVKARSDPPLVVMQVRNGWKVNEENYTTARPYTGLVEGLETFEIRHIHRESNGG